VARYLIKYLLSRGGWVRWYFGCHSFNSTVASLYNRFYNRGHEYEKWGSVLKIGIEWKNAPYLNSRKVTVTLQRAREKADTEFCPAQFLPLVNIFLAQPHHSLSNI